MTTREALLICICCAIAASPAWAQTATTPSRPGILGYLDPQTGAFRAIPASSAEDADAPAATTFTGTINVTLTITLKTAGLTNITCTQSVSVLDGTTAPTFFSESNTVAATGSGTTRTCKLSIPYSWVLTSQASENMSTGYAVVGSTGTTGLPQRTNDRSPLDTRKVPANGTITTLTAAVTL
jgi:hypothetical protein